MAAKKGRELEVIISVHTKTATYPDAPHTPFGIKNSPWVKGEPGLYLGLFLSK